MRVKIKSYRKVTTIMLDPYTNPNSVFVKTNC